MNNFERMYRLSKEAKENFPPGTRIELISMDDPIHPIPSGTRETVDHVDDIGNIHTKWDNGRYLAVIYGEDNFRKLTAAELENEGKAYSVD